eukprot:m.6621 g.6621  ORF g.6621 m.6621 type:complete len:1050 (+) comp3560_c0_seq1:189-3338(+)
MLFGYFFILSTIIMVESSETVVFERFYINLRPCNHERGIMSHTVTPKLSWAYTCPVQCKQIGFTIQISNLTSIVWNYTASSADEVTKTQITVPSGLLTEATTYTWRVAPSTNVTSMTWSPQYSFFTALKNFSGEPVWAQKNASGKYPSYAFLHHTVLEVDAANVKSATLYITANPPPGQAQHPPKILSGYKVWINNKLIGIGPGRSRCEYKATCLRQPEHVYDGFDVTMEVKEQLPNKPVDSVDIFAAGYGDWNAPTGAPRIIAELHIVMRDWITGEIKYVQSMTNGSWDAMDVDDMYNPGANSGCSWYFYPKENINASRAPAGTPLSPHPELQYTATAWEKASVVGSFPAPLVAKPVSPLMISQIPSTSVRVIQTGYNHFFFDVGRNIQGGVRLSVSLPTASASSVTVTVAEELVSNTSIMFPPRTGTSPQTTWSLSPTTSQQSLEHFEYLEWRYGELQFGGSVGTSCGDHVNEESTAYISCEGSGVITNFSFASFGTSSGKCDAGPLALNASCNSPSTLQVLSAACVGKASCEIKVDRTLFGKDPCEKVPKWLTYNATCSNPQNPPKAISIEDFNVSAWVIKAEYNESTSASMATSNATLDAVWELCRYTIEAGPLDLYSDSNARQRSVDCQADDVTAMMGQYATSEQLALQRFAIEQSIGDGPSSRADWKILPIIATLFHTLHTGDLTLAAKEFDNLEANFSVIQSISNKTGLVEGETCLVDWPNGMRDRFVFSETSTIASAWVYYGATSLAKLATFLNRTSDEVRLSKIAEDLKAAMNEKQWNGTAFCDGVCSNISHTAFHSTMYPLAFGAVSDENFESAWRYVKGRINPPFNMSSRESDSKGWPPPEPYSGVGIPAGVYPAQYAVQGLYMNDKDKGASALEVLTSNATNGWVAMLRQGATMTMEMWNAEEKPNLTWSHPWASSPAFLIAWYLFGIRPTSPGFQTVEIKPQVGTLTHGKYRLPTIRGPISVSFSSEESIFGLNVQLPNSIQASLIIPAPSSVSDTSTHVAVTIDGNEASLPLENGFVRVRAGPGGFTSIQVQDLQ